MNLDNLSGEDDNVTVKSLAGPLLINGGEGMDFVLASSDDHKLELIDALLVFDGGDDEDEDILTLDNSNDANLDDELYLTRLVAEVDSMESPSLVSTGSETNPVLPRDSYFITLRNATGGTFTLEIYDPVTNTTMKTRDIPHDASQEYIEKALDVLIIGRTDNDRNRICGANSTSECADSVNVFQMGTSDTYAIFFLGERLNSGVQMTLDTSSLHNMYEELYKNETNDILAINSDVLYKNVDTLNIFMGQQDIVANIRGTSASNTHITLQDGDDKIFISSDADENIMTAGDTDVLYGTLDYIEGDLYIHSHAGRHRLMMSDKNSYYSKGVGINGPAELNRSSLIDLADNLGNIYFTINETAGNWHDGINLFLGAGDDELTVTSIPGSTDVHRATTSVHAGNGADVLVINLSADENEIRNSLFVANGQGDDDILDASGSSLPVILIGDGVSIFPC